MGNSRGYAVIPRWLLYDAATTPNAKLVYLVLQSHVGKNATAFPAVSRIAEEAGISDSSVRRAIRELTARDLLTIRRRRRRDGGSSSNEYTLKVHL